MRRLPSAIAYLSAAAVLVGALAGSASAAGASTAPAGGGVEVAPGGSRGSYIVPSGIHKIKHVIIIMQENRSFDEYFGTYPGADGFRQPNGTRPCIPNGPKPKDGCTKPYHSTSDVTVGGPHGEQDSDFDINGGKMNGFIIRMAQKEAYCRKLKRKGGSCRFPTTPPSEVMAYQNTGEIPNYWKYAENFALDDHMFEAVGSWSLPEHLFIVSGWAAACKNRDPYSCINDAAGPYSMSKFNTEVAQEIADGKTDVHLAWTDITWLLHNYGISWAYYVETGTEPDCADDSDITCPEPAQSYRTPGIWNPLPLFEDVHKDGQEGNIQPLDNYLAAAKTGTLPSVSWIVPSSGNSEHPPKSIHQGQAYTTALINAAMEGPEWDSTAIFLSWDDWGGMYDSVVPPTVDENGYGIRVPSLVISPYARRGFVDHQTLSSDAYLKFIEDDFMSAERLNPATDERPDPRPDVRENEPELGNLARDFNFNQAPRPPLLLPTNPPSDSPTLPSYFADLPACYGCTTTPPWNSSPQVPNPHPEGSGG